MATITPDEGLEFTADRIIGAPEMEGWELWQVAVGTGSTSPQNTDTQLDVEEYRGDRDDSIVSIEDSSIDGRIIARITISGGTEVPAGTTITEFGLFAADSDNAPADDTADADDRLLHREVRDSGVTIDSGDRKTFEITFDVER